MMKTGPLLAALVGTFVAPALAAPADPHAGHHPAETTAPAKPTKPATAADPASMQHNCPMMAGMGNLTSPGGHSPATGGPSQTMMHGKTMSSGMMHNCMMHDGTPATPPPDARKHE
jgi:hypothetical protein